MTRLKNIYYLRKLEFKVNDGTGDKIIQMYYARPFFITSMFYDSIDRAILRSVEQQLCSKRKSKSREILFSSKARDNYIRFFNNQKQYQIAINIAVDVIPQNQNPSGKTILTHMFTLYSNQNINWNNVLINTDSLHYRWSYKYLSRFGNAFQNTLDGSQIQTIV